MEKRLVVYGPAALLETIKAVWAGQGLRFEVETIGELQQPVEEEEIEKNLVALTEVMAQDDALPEDAELNETSIVDAPSDEVEGEESIDEVQEEPDTKQAPKKGRKGKGKSK
jgi:hypothetical protein